MINITDNDFSSKLPHNFGIDISFSNNGEDFITVYNDIFPRKVTLDITTWKGMTPGALHYYGELRVSSLQAKHLHENSIQSLDGNAPKEAHGMKIQLTRPIRRKDLRIDRGERFKGAKIGDKIKNFDSKVEVEEAAISFFKKYFTGSWSLVKVSPVTSSTINGTAILNEESVLCEQA